MLPYLIPEYNLEVNAAATVLKLNNLVWSVLGWKIKWELWLVLHNGAQVDYYCNQ